MEYYDDDDYIGASPGLTPFQPDLGGCPPLSFPPSWLFQDICDTPLNPVHIERAGDGLEARRKLHKFYRIHDLQCERAFMDTVLLHQMAPSDPRLTFSLGSCDILGNNSSDGSMPTLEPRSNSQTSGLSPSTEARRPMKHRLGLPITVHRQGILATVLSCANTSADANIISDEVARKLGHSRNDEVTEEKTFSLADGNIVRTSGRIELVCSFGIEAESLVTMTCTFYVLRKGATLMIMGSSFLKQTKTMTEHRDRLVHVPTSAFQALSLFSVDRPRQLLTCQLNCEKTIATPASGTEINLISPSFVSERGLRVHRTKNTIELADGSITTTTGFVRAKLSIEPIHASGPDYHPKSKTTVEFLLVKRLKHDIVVNTDSLEALKVFTHHQDALIPAPRDCSPLGLNQSRHLQAMDAMVWKIQNVIKEASCRNQNDGDMRTYPETALMDQHENERRECEATRIARLPEDEMQAAIVAEATKQDAYAHDPFSGSTTGPLACGYPGCDAEPLWTQQLLDSHKNTHYIRRLHYCPVASCPRSQGGKGFKNKVEMIRHGIVHQSLAYACPFCPAGFLGPDSLAQHVRADHRYVGSNNHELLAVLARRSERGSRGLGRKATGTRR